MPKKITKQTAAVVDTKQQEVKSEEIEDIEEIDAPEDDAVDDEIEDVPVNEKKVSAKKVSNIKKTVGKNAKKIVKKAVKKSIKKAGTRKTKKTAKKKHVKKVTKKVVKKIELPKLSEATEPRYFKLLSGIEATPVGRFSGNKPKQAANKALTSIIKTLEKKGENTIGKEIKFTLKECTRWNKKKFKKGDKTHKKIEKKYSYVGKRELLKNEIIVDHIHSECDEKMLKAGKITSEKQLTNGETKYYIDVKEKDEDGKEVEKHIIVKKLSIRDPKTKQPTGSFKYAIVNEIKYKCTNKVKKCKPVESTTSRKKSGKQTKTDSKKEVKDDVKNVKDDKKDDVKDVDDAKNDKQKKQPIVSKAKKTKK